MTDEKNTVYNMYENYKDNNISFMEDDDDHLARNIKSYKICV